MVFFKKACGKTIVVVNPAGMTEGFLIMFWHKAFKFGFVFKMVKKLI